MPTKEHLIDCYRKMLVIRNFEIRVEDLFSKGMIMGTAHTCIGQEAVAVGASSALRKKDYVTSNHRGHGHFIARGGDPGRMMAELFGKVEGYSGGRGGSQLMADYSLGFIGGNGITGGSIPVATGIALSAQLKKNRRIAACFFGDGAANQGAFHESLNMAGLWRLPVIYICENNLYAMSTPVQRSTAVCNIADRAVCYGIKGRSVDGNDFFAVRDAVLEARKRALASGGPTLLECRTYRLSGHSRGDPRRYRTRDEEKKAWVKEPIRRFRRYLVGQGIITREHDRRIVGEARKTISDAVRFAREGNDPDPAVLEKGVFA